jgi:protease I
MSQERATRTTRRQALTAAFGAAGLAFAAGPRTLAAEAAGKLQGKRVLLGISDFSESLETYYMFYRLKEEGVVPVVVAPKKKQVEMVIHFDHPDYLSYLEKPGYPIDAQLASAEVDPSQYDGLLLPGGRAPEELRLDPGMQKIVAHFLTAKKPLGAMCHGVMLLYTAGSIQGRRLTGNRQIRPDIDHYGGAFLDQPVVVDGALVTSRGWLDLDAFMPQFLKVLAHA